MSTNSALGGTWEDLQKELFTQEEIEASQFRVAIMQALIQAGHSNGISQKRPEQSSHCKKPDKQGPVK